MLEEDNTRTLLCALTIALLALPFCSESEEDSRVLAIENEACRIQFDARTGGLQSIVNRVVGDACLKNHLGNHVRSIFPISAVSSKDAC